MRDVLAIKPRVERVGVGGLGALVIAGQGETRGITRGIKTVGVVEVAQGLLDSPRLDCAITLFVKISPAGLGHAVPKAGSHDVHDTDRVADGAEKSEEAERAEQINARQDTAEVTSGASPKRAHVDGVRRATQADRRGHQQRADPRKSSGTVPV